MNNYRKEVEILKKTFSETKKTEIKNKILEIKDHIYWIRSNPIKYYKRSHSNDSISKILTFSYASDSKRIKKPAAFDSAYSSKLIEMYLLDTISKIRFARDEYVFVNSLSGMALVSNGEYNKTPVDIFSSRDTAWIKVFRIQQLSAYQPDGVFYTYLWGKISASQISLKTSYFSYLPEYKWIIGTGFYEDDIEQLIELKRKELKADLGRGIIKIVIFLLISTLLNYMVVLFLSKQLEKDISLFRSFFKRAADESIMIDKSRVNFKEFETIAEAANVMIDERSKAEISLRESEERYRFLFEHNPASMLIYDHNTFQLLAVNEAFRLNYGYKEEEALQMLLPDLYPEEEKVPIVELAKSLTGHSYVGEWHHIKKDGSVNAIIATSHDIIYIGHEARVAVITDITDRKKAEKEIEQLNRTLEERISERTSQLLIINKELESFSYSISHDLRAPLRAIYGFSQILSTRHSPSLNEEGRKYMNFIVEASIRMEHLINDLLNYSRLGRKSVHKRPVSLNLIFTNVQSDFKQRIEETGADFTVDKDMPVIQGDESLLRQIFTNLVENAITYRRTEVPLKIDISYEHDNEAYIVKVSDNGIGIPEEYSEKIFNIFQRLHSEDKYPGTGIGLATVRKAVSMLDGTVWVKSVVGEGSIFYIRFPEYKNLN